MKAPLTERYRPSTLDQFVGLDKPKRAMGKLIADPHASAWFFEGPSGVGKTSMARAVASALNAELIHIASQECNLEAIDRITRTCAHYPAFGHPFRVILVDEADEMTRAAQNAFLSILDNIPAQTIFIFTANSREGLEARFLSRALPLKFSSEGMNAPAAELLARVWDAEADAEAERPNFTRIVKESNNNVRASLMRLHTELLCA